MLLLSALLEKRPGYKSLTYLRKFLVRKSNENGNTECYLRNVRGHASILYCQNCSSKSYSLIYVKLVQEESYRIEFLYSS